MLTEWLGVSDVKDIQDLRVHYSHSGWPLATQGLEILTLHLSNITQFYKHASRKETDGPAQVPWVMNRTEISKTMVFDIYVNNVP